MSCRRAHAQAKLFHNESREALRMNMCAMAMHLTGAAVRHLHSKSGSRRETYLLKIEIRGSSHRGCSHSTYVFPRMDRPIGNCRVRHYSNGLNGDLTVVEEIRLLPLKPCLGSRGRPGHRSRSRLSATGRGYPGLGIGHRGHTAGRFHNTWTIEHVRPDSRPRPSPALLSTIRRQFRKNGETAIPSCWPIWRRA